MNGGLGVLAVTLAATVGLAGCSANGSHSASRLDKAGGRGLPITLRLGTADESSQPSGPVVLEFARQVESLSEGRLAIEPVWLAQGREPRGWDQQVAAQVVRRELEMALVPARAWDVLGVTTLDALQAPLLVDSPQLVADIVDSDIETDLLAGLDPLGIVGLALVPESLRHPFSFDTPLLAPGDFEGRTYWAPRSDAVWATLRALGANPDDHELFDRVRDGAITAADTDFAWAAWLLPRPAIATANVTLYTKFQSLVINKEVFDRLPTGDQEALRRAGAATRDGALSTMSANAELVRHFCAHGGEIVLASEANLSALAIAVEPVVDGMEADRTTASLIARIRELKDALGDDVGKPMTCPD